MKPPKIFTKYFMPKSDFKIEYVPLEGGLDLINPSISGNPGKLLFCKNYELDLQGKCRLIDGYEVFDGRPKPSEASYWILDFDGGTAAISVGNIVTGAVGMGEVLYVVLESGSWAGGDAAGYLVLFNVTTGFINNENLQVSAVTKAIVDGIERENDADTDALDSIYLIATIAALRADIAIVPGSGNILGVWQYKGVKYAFRNNAAGTETIMFKSSTAGWTQCNLGERLAFNTGTVVFVEGETITQGAVTAVVRRVVVQSGTWTGGNASGYFTISGRAGGNFAAGAIAGSIVGAATAVGAQTSYQFSAPSGKFEFINTNLRGHSSTLRMYGCDGKNKAFEWDGTYFTTIETGMTTDKPTHIAEFRKHLFLMFSGGSIQHSSIGDPLAWSAVTGAAEIGVGDEGVGFLSMYDALVIFTRNSTKVLSGYDADTWNLRPYADDSGAIEWTIQGLGSGIYLDDRGLTTLSATQEYGDFKANTLSKYVEPYLKQRLSLAQSSVRIKEKNQYRIFFSDLTVLTLTLSGNKVVGFSQQLYDKLPVCVCSSENLAGEEEIYFGSTDGFVYQLDKGTSFNGNAITASLKARYNHLKTPNNDKRIRKLVLEVDAPIDTYIRVGVDFNYGEEGGPNSYFSTESSGGLWDVDNWNSFNWDGKSMATASLDIYGTGLNFSPTIYHSGVFELQSGSLSPRSGLTNAGPHIIHGYIVHYDLLGRVQR